MKYIRTKDGNIYETKDLIRCKDSHYPNDWFTKSGVPLTAIKESDNIEDLCDEFAVVGTDSHRFMQIDFIKENYSPNLWGIYGVIRTDIGFIYIAKLTEKGWKLI